MAPWTAPNCPSMLRLPAPTCGERIAALSLLSGKAAGLGEVVDSHRKFLASAVQFFESDRWTRLHSTIEFELGCTDLMRKKQPQFSKKAASTGPYRSDGKLSRRCVVCGKKKRMFSHERMCLQCRVKPAEERKQIRAEHGGKRRRSIYAVSGGLPSLGKRN